MAALFAVTLAGIPGTIVNGVLLSLRERYSDRHTFRAAGVPLRADKFTVYDSNIANKVVELATDAIFGHSKKPWSFCTGKTKPCALQEGGNKSCLRNANQTCSLKKPRFCLLFLQAGRNYAEIMDKIHYSCYVKILPVSCYNNKQRTISEITAALEQAAVVVGKIAVELNSARSPFFLPPINFGDKKLKKLLNEAQQGDNPGLVSEKIRDLFFSRKDQSYKGRSNLIFKSCAPQERHGLDFGQMQADIAVTKHYRLGCLYEVGIHQDVTRENNLSFDGKIGFFCRTDGNSQYPKGVKNFNVYTDDCLR